LPGHLRLICAISSPGLPTPTDQERGESPTRSGLAYTSLALSHAYTHVNVYGEFGVLDGERSRTQEIQARKELRAQHLLLSGERTPPLEGRGWEAVLLQLRARPWAWRLSGDIRRDTPSSSVLC
jgi:hypothetical protein